ncbi:MAG: tyrosine-type recombinase/integrase [Candidatus Anammoximicrobium sp.]|nr:tyrosine-type recombinase/integrase [Candidatus Anammoximicrobium sp.]
MIEAAGQRAKRRFVEFFAANIRNDNTRQAYLRAVEYFCAWCDAHRISLVRVEPTIVAMYVEQLMRDKNERTGKPYADASVKQHLAAVRMLFDYLTTGGVVPFNPASSVRGPKLVVEKGKTPVLSAADARRLFNAIDVTRVGGLRDRALIGVMVYGFARIGATLKMNVDDLYENNGRTLWLRLHEKGGKYHEMPAHHKLAQFLDEYLTGAGIVGERGTPLFRTLDRKKNLTENRMLRQDAWAMIKRRARDAGVTLAARCHSFRATAITEFIRNGGSVENARKMAAHASSRTTNMYIRIDEEMKLEEVERVRI